MAKRQIPNLAAAGSTAANPKYQTKTATLVNVTDAQMLVKFYTPKQTLLDNPRCVVPYYEWQIFKTGQNTGLPQALAEIDDGGVADARTYGRVSTSTLSSRLLAGTQLISSNIQLQSIPERILVFVRRIKSNLNCCDTDSYLAI